MTLEPLTCPAPEPALHPPTERPRLVMDLDETLVHVTALPTRQTEFAIRVGRRKVHVRPHASDVLSVLHVHYDVFIFTAAAQEYADQIIDKAFPFIRQDRRLYADSCRYISGYRVKDLTLLGPQLDRVVLIDDIVGSAMLQPKNLFIVPPWMGEADDVVFLVILPYLIAASTARNVVAELRGMVAMSDGRSLQILTE
jgi:RNA polymerase II subunit A small phosphatase-like protein